MKSAGPTTALAQVPQPPCCCARGWLASQARSRSTTPTETPGHQEQAEERMDHGGLKGPKHQLLSQGGIVVLAGTMLI